MNHGITYETELHPIKNPQYPRHNCVNCTNIECKNRFMWVAWCHCTEWINKRKVGSE